MADFLALSQRVSAGELFHARIRIVRDPATRAVLGFAATTNNSESARRWRSSLSSLSLF